MAWSNLLALTIVSVVQSGDPIDAFQQACLAQTPDSRESLRDTARRLNWRRARLTTPAGLSWRDGYDQGQAIVRLDQHRPENGAAGERICIVLVEQKPADWKERVSGLSASGVLVGAPGEYDRSIYDMPDDLTLTIWDLPDGSRIHALETQDGMVELSVNYPTGQ